MSSNHRFSKYLRDERLLMFLCDACAAFTLPPFYLFPLLIIAYGGLFYALMRVTTVQEDSVQEDSVKGASVKKAANIGFFWSWGFHIFGLYWFTIALLTEPEKFAWLIPFALFGLTAVIALYTMVFAIVFHYILSYARSYARQIFPQSALIQKSALIQNHSFNLFSALLFALLFTASEYARGNLLSGFPWNLGGYVFAVSDASIQLASIFGIYGLTFIAVFLGAVCFVSKKAAFGCWLLLACGISWGAWRAETAPRDFVPDVKLRLVQANIQQHHKWNGALQMQGLRKHIALSHSAGYETVTHIIWPETAIPYIVHDNSILARRLGAELLPGQYLISGALRANAEGVTNSIVAIDNKGEIKGQYDKRKLVPFGEFLPLRFIIPAWLETPVGISDLASGSGQRISSWPGLPDLLPLICYEVIFPQLAFSQMESEYDDEKSGTTVKSRASWLLSLTNDAWFGTSSAPYQHLAMARMRAVEQGLPLVRVANSGISAVFDAYGREVAVIGLNSEGFVDVFLPLPSRNRTFFSSL